MAQPKSKRRSRKRNRSGTRPRGGRETVPAGPRPARATERRAAPADRAPNSLKAYGEPPPNRFGGVPVAEIAIFAGSIGFLVGLVSRAPVPLLVGVGVCALGVLEFTSREHFSGYRSHTSLLAAFPALVIEAALVVGLHPRQPVLVLPAVIPIYAVAFWLLRRRFLAARQLRLARPPAP
jgi:hypothetical protein